MSAAKLVEQLDKARQTAPDRWIARCPAHEDNGPSLSVRELSDGRTLIHCFAGCGAVDVMAAAGLEMTDLFPERLPDQHYKPCKSRIPARDLLMLISQEAGIVALIAADFLEKRQIDEATWSRLAAAANRIGRARDHVG